MTNAHDISGIHLWLVLWKASKAMEHYDRSSIASTGLCLTDFAVLEAILHKGPLPVNVIGKKVLLTSGSITSAVDRLASLNLVKRLPDPDDKRVAIVHFTPQGEKLICKAFKEHSVRMQQAAEILSQKERAELIRLLKKIGYHATTLTPHPSSTPNKKKLKKEKS